MLYILKSFYNTLIVYPKEKRATQSVSKSTNAFFNQLLGFFSSSCNLKSYAVHSAIKVSNFIFR